MKKKTAFAKKAKSKKTRVVKEKPTSPSKRNSAGRQVLIGKVSHYFGNIKVAAVKLKAPLKKGDTIRIEGGTASVRLKVFSLQKNRKPVASAKTKDEIGVRVPKKVREGYRVFKI